MANGSSKSVKDTLNGLMREAVCEDVRMSIRHLLETKFLYQSVKVEWKTVAKEAKRIQDRFKDKNELLDIGDKSVWSNELAAFLLKSIAPIQNGAWNLVPELRAPQSPVNQSGEFAIIAPQAELYCRACKATKAHNSGSLEIETVPPPYPTSRKGGHQVFTCGYECQRCRCAPLVHQITRRDEKLIITGCSEYPHVSVPKEFPEDIVEYISEAKVANGTGRTLAGLFFLRTAIEQHMRKITDLDGRQTGDELAAAYREFLDPELPGREWILGRAYDELSSKLHTADADESQFSKTLAELERYFKALALYPLKSKATLT